MFKALNNFLYISLLLLLLTGCSAPQKATLRFLFPIPPETPRLEWLASYSSDNDFPKTEAQRNLEKLAGKHATQLKAPTGVASDGDGKIFVGDGQTNNILVFDLKGKAVTYLLGDGEVQPRQMTFDSRKQLYVVDSSHNCVKVFSREGKLLRSYGSQDELQRPLGVAIDEVRKRLYVSDGLAHQVRVFDLDSGRLTSSLGTGNTTKKPGDLYNPAGLAISTDGTLCVVEHLNARVSVFNPDGTLRKLFGTRDAGESGFENPRGAAFDSEGNLWLVDFRRNALRAFDLDGRLLFVHEGLETSSMGFSTPTAIHIDANDEIFIADFAAGRFSHWRYLSKTALARHPVTTADLELISRSLAGEEEIDVNPSPRK